MSIPGRPSADRDTRDHAVSLGASRRGEVRALVHARRVFILRFEAGCYWLGLLRIHDAL
jgi:hypothetical protein